MVKLIIGSMLKLTVFMALLVIALFTDASAARGRTFSPTYGRFTQRDTLATAYQPPITRNLSDSNFTKPDSPSQYYDGMNLYQYVQSNSMRLLDPSGLFGLGEHKGMIKEVLESKLSCKCYCSDNDDFEDGLLDGSVYPDIPSGYISTGMMFAAKSILSEGMFKAIYENSLSYQSHFGDLQWWHGMSSNEEGAQELRKKIIMASASGVYLSRYKGTSCEEKGQLIGKMLHTIQDTFAKSHTARNSSGEITLFQDYTKQDSGKHSNADNKDDNIDQYNSALDATARLLNMIVCEKAGLGKIRQVLENEILRLDPSVGIYGGVGGTVSDYAGE